MLMKAWRPGSFAEWDSADLDLNGLIATGFVAISAAFRPAWPIWGIDGSCCSGVFFNPAITAYNTIAYARFRSTG